MSKNTCFIVAAALAALLMVGCKSKQSGIPESDIDAGAAPLTAAPPPPEPEPVAFTPEPAAPARIAAPSNYEPVFIDDGTPRPGGTYTIRKGDTLWNISQRAYGNGKHWRRLAEANSGLDPRRLRIGQSIAIP